MQLSNAPTQIVLPFANGDGTKTNPIPVPSQIPITPGAASFTDGFPPLCATPVSSGGVPPSKADMDGILFMLSGIDRWVSAGANFQFSSAFATAVGGYPQGARVLNAAGTGYWINTTDNNSTNPDTGAAPTGWIPDRAVASVYASAQQTLSIGGSKVLWDSVEFDEFGMWDAPNKRFKAPWSGYYRIHGATLLKAPAAPQGFASTIFHNGSFVKQCLTMPQVTDADMGYPFEAIIPLSPGDYLEHYIVGNSSAIQAGEPTGSSQAYVYGQIEYLGS